MVCLGNICRSPLAEGIMRQKVEEQGIDVEVDSAGTSNWHSGEGPDPRSVEIARKNGLDISYQRARQFEVEDFDRFDLILAMDQSNQSDLHSLASDDRDRQKVQLILDFCEDMRGKDVPDPYWDGNFQRVYDMLDEACDQLIERSSDLFR